MEGCKRLLCAAACCCRRCGDRGGRRRLGWLAVEGASNSIWAAGLAATAAQRHACHAEPAHAACLPSLATDRRRPPCPTVTPSRQAPGYARGAPAHQDPVDPPHARAAPPAQEVPRWQEDRQAPLPRAVPQGALQRRTRVRMSWWQQSAVTGAEASAAACDGSLGWCACLAPLLPLLHACMHASPQVGS